MSDVVHRTTKQYLRSVSTGDYPVQDWIINPNLSAVTGFASKYWTITVDVVTLMTQGERDAVDSSEAAAVLASARAGAKADYDSAIARVEKLSKAIALVALDQINILRTDAARPVVTAAQMKTAIEAKVDTL